MKEKWLPVVGFEGLYEVSDLGRVRGLPRMIGEGTGRGGQRMWPGGIRKIQYRPDGYAIVCVSRKGKNHPRLLHRLVLDAFVGLRPKGHEGAHEDGVRGNCRLSNLSWKTPAGNAKDRLRHGTTNKGSKSYAAKLTEEKVLKIRDLAATGRTRLSIAKEFGVGEPAVDKIVWRQRWTHI